MPRHPTTGVYTYPPGIEAVTDQTIVSTDYNSFLNDVQTDLNLPRPVSSGGTGAASAAESLFNLGGEKATQVVTNYDSHVWVPGSFRSAAGATGAPNAHAFAGVCYIGEALANPPTNANVVIEARDLEGPAGVPGAVYVRQKKAGVWTGWGITTGDDQAAARQTIYAAPLDALAYNGMQINGSFEVSQEKTFGTNTSMHAAGAYICDGWKLAGSGTMAVVGAVFQPYTAISGFPSILFTQTSTAAASLAAGDYVYITQCIEGYRISRLGWGFANAQSVTIGFWTAHHRTGTYSGGISNEAANRSYTFTYTQNVADVPEYKTVTIPGDVTGTWATANGIGFRLNFAIAMGATYTASSANTWAAGNFIAAPGQINAVASTSDVFRITGVVVLPGNEAPSAARSPLIMRPYDQELLTCQRYWYKAVAGLQLAVSPSAYYSCHQRHPVVMRATPTMTTLGVIQLTNFNAPLTEQVSNDAFRCTAQATAVTGQGGFLVVFNTDARL